ncbi:MAG: molybdopterin-dependent oxidoreductase [Candidatus Tectomicrobia bacterium]|nr:molybdopterin-dependent oxidoreductase [Candidatus Tectomicrobia bacterium]
MSSTLRAVEEGLQLAIHVNGTLVEREVDPQRMLLRLLRDDLRLLGTKNGCDIGQCGSCTVIANGKAIRSCITPLEKCQGAVIETIEGIGTPEDLHPLQESFLIHQGSQCGFCTPGQIMSAKVLLEKNPNPTVEDVKRALTGNLCRCTGYQQILESVLDAARIQRERKAGRWQHVLANYNRPAVDHLMFDRSRLEFIRSEVQKGGEVDGRGGFGPAGDLGGFNVVGTSVIRADGVNNVTGRSKFSDDVDERFMEGMLELVIVRPTGENIHADILNIDTSAAEAVPGVAAVFTHKDIPGENAYGLGIRDNVVLCDTRTRSCADAVAMVVAERRDIAEQAAALVRVDYRPLPLVANPGEALAPDAPEIHGDVQGTKKWTVSHADIAGETRRKNILGHTPIRKGDIERGFAEADVIVERTYQTQGQDHVPMEPECGMAYVDDQGVLVIRAPSQHVYMARLNVARALGLENHQVRILGASVGGGFGKRDDTYAQLYVGLAAWLLKRPVRTSWSREECALVTSKRHSHLLRLKVGVTKEGKLTAWEAEVIGDTGAYASWGQNVLKKSALTCTGPYEVPNVKIDTFAVYTNTPLRGAIRGFGTMQSALAHESHMDEIAKAIGMDPLELRRRNALCRGKRTATRQAITDSAASLRCLEACAKAFDWEHRETRRQVDDPLIRRGFGIGNIWYPIGFGSGIPDQGNAIAELFPDGTAHGWMGTTDYGQGSNTIFRQILAEELGLPMERVELTTADTFSAPNCGSTSATRQTYVTGGAIKHAGRLIRERMLKAAASLLEASPDDVTLKNGFAFVRGTSKPKIPATEIVRAMEEQGLARRAQYLFRAERFTSKTDPETGAGVAMNPIAWGCQMAEVEVNIKTGRVKVTRMVAAHYVGRALNPQSVRGQIVGGISFGWGFALSEDPLFARGIPQARNFDKYRTMRIKDLPEITTIIVEADDDGVQRERGAYGAIGIGEPPTVAAGPAIVNAIADALGKRLCITPQTPERIKALLRGDEAAIDPKVWKYA